MSANLPGSNDLAALLMSCGTEKGGGCWQATFSCPQLEVTLAATYRMMGPRGILIFGLQNPGGTLSFIEDASLDGDTKPHFDGMYTARYISLADAQPPFAQLHQIRPNPFLEDVNVRILEEVHALVDGHERPAVTRTQDPMLQTFIYFYNELVKTTYFWLSGRS
jgi:hypothetical protein